MILNDVVSCDSNLASADATNFYLGADLPEPQSLKMCCDTFDDATLILLGFKSFLKTEPPGKTYAHCNVLRSMPGLAISGLLGHLRLLAQLCSHDFIIQTATPCLFCHRTRDITFALVVDDFAIKCSSLDDLKYFTACLSELHHAKVHPECASFLGFNIDYDRVARAISFSCPSCIPDLLTRLNMPNLRTCKSPCVYAPPDTGSIKPQVAHTDTSPLASKEKLKTLQIIIGSMLCCARAVDATMLTAACLLSSQQPAPTAATTRAAHPLFGYAKLHPNHIAVFKPSDVMLRVHSDASHLNRPKSGSTAGGFHYVGTADPTFYNGPAFCHCARMPARCAAASEAECAGVFCDGQVVVDERTILSSLGHPQHTTTIFCDDECAVGLAEQTARPKKSKSVDVRLEWIQDFFTKSLPVHAHQELAPYHASTPSTVPAALSTVPLQARVASDTGATHLLLRHSARTQPFWHEPLDPP
jgi:hypothetical protein